MGSMKREALLEELAPLTKLIAQELAAQLKEHGLVLAPGTNGGQVTDPIPTGGQELSTLKETAVLLGHSYFWLSRNYKRLNLRPVRISGKLLFTRQDVENLLNRQKARFRGRPPRPSDQPPLLGLYSRLQKSPPA